MARTGTQVDEGTVATAPRRQAAHGVFPWYGLLGAAILLVGGALFAARWRPVVVFFTPIAWTGYILLADAVVCRRVGTSLIRGRPREFVLMLPRSNICWLLFEFYNLHLHNWHYTGTPSTFAAQSLLGYWSYATVFPGVLETADLLGAFGLFANRRVRPWQPRRATLYAWMLVGAVCLVVPLLVPEATARYLFGAVWLGFIMLLDPLNYLRSGRSLVGEWTEGRLTLTLTLLAAGVVTGLLWESWNYKAAARWVYTVPPPLGFGPRIFEMPPLGFIGFLPFAIEIYCMQAFLLTLLRVTPGITRPTDKD
ncbi:MAG: hypothetical protein ACTHMJ_20130 [Thermomicrobiales bacterium]